MIKLSVIHIYTYLRIQLGKYSYLILFMIRINVEKIICIDQINIF